MFQFLQIILINLVVSCDNVGVVALATRDLPEDKAARARQLGIGLSFILKLLFIALISYLFSVQWLHIRIIGGVLLVYVTFNMLPKETPEHSRQEKQKKDSFINAIITIIAADISMSLDNVIAILGIVSADGQRLGVHSYLMVAVALLLCLPLLFWFSNSIADLMEKYPILVYVCAGYLIYTANKIIIADESIALFLKQIEFTFIEPAAILCGLLLLLYGIISEKIKPCRKSERSNALPIYAVLVLFSIIIVGIVTYLNTSQRWNYWPSDDFHGLQNIVKTGASSIYLLGTESEVLGFCCLAFTSITFHKYKDRRFHHVISNNCRAMIIFTLLFLTIVTIGLTYTFGFGMDNLLTWILNLLLLSGLLLTYPAIFALIASCSSRRSEAVKHSLLYMLVEAILTAIGMANDTLLPLAGLIPKYYLSNYPFLQITPLLVIRILLVTAIYIGTCIFVTDRSLRRI